MGAGLVTRDEIVKRPFVRAEAAFPMPPLEQLFGDLQLDHCRPQPIPLVSVADRPRNSHQSPSVQRRRRSVRSVEACKPNAIVALRAKVRAPRCQFRRKSVFVKRSEQTGFRALIEPVSGDIHSRQNAAKDRD